MKIVIPVLIFFTLLYAIPLNNLEIDDAKRKTINVSIQGMVIEEKIVEVKKYSTIEDVLGLVDLMEEADITSINRLQVLKDGDVIVIPKKVEVKKISINNATVEELMTVKGIGEAKARSIVEYREKHGLFQSLEQLMNIPGIKEKTFEKLKEFLSL